jgi:Secretion system C-terminal sorting domain
MKEVIGIFYLIMLTGSTMSQAVVTASGNVHLNSNNGTRLVIQGGISFTGTSNIIDNGRVDLLTSPLALSSNWNDATAGGSYNASGTGHVYFSASGLQTITGPTQFYNVTMDGATGISLGSDIEIRNQLNLDGGMFTTGANKVYVSNGATNAIQSNNSFTSFINGRLERFTNIAASDYLFPVGKVDLGVDFYAPIRLNKINANTTRYTTEFFRGLPFDDANVQNPPIDHISHIEYWEITSTSPGGSADDDAALSLSWRTASTISTNPAEWDNLMIAHYYNNSGFSWRPEFNTSLANIISGVASFGYITSNITVGSFTNADRRFTIASRTPYNPLPVNNFKWAVTPVNQTSLIRWDIENDSQVAWYEVEKSSDGNQFSSISVTPSRQTNSTHGYTVVDAVPYNGWNYYRIRIKNKPGTYYYSDIKKVRFVLPGIDKIYPNPATDILNLRLSNNPGTGAVIRIIDANGRIVYQTRALFSTMQIPVQQLMAGNYTIQYISNGTIRPYQFIKTNK